MTILPVHLCDRKQMIDCVQAHRYLFLEMSLPVISHAEFQALVSFVEHQLSDYSALDFMDEATQKIHYTEEQILLAQNLLATLHRPAPHWD